MPHPVYGLPEEKVPHQAVTMRTDDQKIDRILPEVCDKLTRGIGAVQQDRAGKIASIAQSQNQLVEVTCIRSGFPVGRVGTVDTGNRGIHHMQEQEIGPFAVRLRQTQGSIQNLGIGLSMLQRHANARQ